MITALILAGLVLVALGVAAGVFIADALRRRACRKAVAR